MKFHTFFPIHYTDTRENRLFTTTKLLNTLSDHVRIYTVSQSGLKDKKLIKSKPVRKLKHATCKLYSRVFYCNVELVAVQQTALINDQIAEWLRRWTANPLSMGLNPILAVIFSSRRKSSISDIGHRTLETQVILYSVQCCYALDRQ